MLTLQFVPHHELEGLDTELKLRKLLNIVRTDRIVLMEGSLTSDEEAKLIEKTMELINKSFKGVEICTIYPQKRNLDFGKIIRREVLKMFGYVGGLTIIGPATIVREIKRDPTKIELLTRDPKNSRRRV